MSRDTQEIVELYESIYMEDMSAGTVEGGTPGGGYGDPKDARIPSLMGSGAQTRKGLLKFRKNRKARKSTTNQNLDKKNEMFPVLDISKKRD